MLEITEEMIAIAQAAYDDMRSWSGIDGHDLTGSSVDDAVDAAKDALYDTYQDITKYDVKRIIERIKR